MLFCLLNNKVSGGNRILLELANRSLQANFDSSLCFLDRSVAPDWFDTHCKVVEPNAENFEKYDFVFAPNASLLPMLLQYIPRSKVILISQGFESYCYGETIAELFVPKKSIENILKLDVPIISTSESIQKLLEEQVGRASYLVPVAIERSQFPSSETADINQTPKRILAVGNFRTRFKGILDLADALDILSKEVPVELVLLTQQNAGKNQFKSNQFPVEFHCDPPQSELAAIYASCHAYCCASWYEGFGLPCLEAFSVGIPVVATQNLGVQEFARSNENILLARPHSPDELAHQLRRALTDLDLRQRLVKNGRATAERYDWQRTMTSFFTALEQIKSSSAASTMSSPSPAQSPAQLQTLLKDLENDGYYTPQEVDSKLRWISGELQALCAAIKAGDIQEVESKKTLATIRQHLQEHLQNPSTNYYKEFKARYDFCQLLTTIEDPKEWQNLLKFS
jgi:L-malate glycosyltransferase